MPTPTYVALATTTLASTDSQIDFTSIPSTYRDLVIVIDTGVTAGAYDIRMFFNADTSTGNYSRVVAWGNGGSVGSLTGAEQITYYGAPRDTQNSTNFVQVMDYSATDKHKTSLVRSNNSASGLDMIASRWANTAAITSVRLLPSANSFTIGSTFSLYGIEA